MELEASPWSKMLYLIRRRAGTSREELIAHWFANHMPAVVEQQHRQAAAGRLAAKRYLATLFEPSAAEPGWDGVAQLWFEEALSKPRTAHGEPPTDSFQEHAEPYLPWATTEYVVMDGELPVEPLTLNPPFPCTRSGFLKITYLVRTRPEVDHEAFFSHWLEVHAPNVASTMDRVGGFRYVVSQSQDPAAETYAGMAELYFHGESEWSAFQQALESDGISDYIDRLEVLPAGTEMIGIP